MNAPALPAWQRDKAWSANFIRELKHICGEFLIGEAPQEEDAQRNTDLIVLKLDPVRVACRVRKNSYLSRYANEFTIRSDRPNGHKTELAKIIEGWGDYILYAFTDAQEQTLAAWLLGDLRVFRLWFNSQLVLHKGELPGMAQLNHDGSSAFRAFRIDELPPPFVVARKAAR